LAKPHPKSFFLRLTFFVLERW